MQISRKFEQGGPKAERTIHQRPVQTPNLFRNGFLPFLESGEFSDVTLIADDREYRLHKLVLGYSSQFFRRAFQSHFKENELSRIEIKFPDPNHRIPIVLRYMYEGVIEITPENQLDLLKIADHFMMNELKTVVTEAILQHTRNHNALELLTQAVQIKAYPLIDECISVITKYFAQSFADRDLSSIDYEYFIRIMKNPNLQVESEAQVYNKIAEYIQGSPFLSLKQRVALFGCVRYRFLSRTDLQEVAKNPSVPRQFLVEALMEKLRVAGVEEDSQLGVIHSLIGSNFADLPQVQSTMRLQKRLDYAIHFEYSTDFDDKGIIHYIATNGGRGEWSNPALGVDPKLKVSFSSIEKGAPHDIVAKQPTECWTMDVPASWFALDFGGSRRLRCTAYSLRHGGNYRADSLRNWDIQGSNDGERWTLLKRHTNDHSLGSNYATATWWIPTEKQAHKFRIFRILQTGHNSSNHNFLVLSGIELYGHLYETSTDDSSASETRTVRAVAGGSANAQTSGGNVVNPPSVGVPSGHESVNDDDYDDDIV